MFQSMENIRFFGYLLYVNGRYKEASQQTELLCSKDDNPLWKYNHALVEIKLGRYDNALKEIKKILELSSAARDKYGINLKFAKKAYWSALQLSGNTDEINTLLLQKQHNNLLKYQQIATLIKDRNEAKEKNEALLGGKKDPRPSLEQTPTNKTIEQQNQRPQKSVEAAPPSDCGMQAHTENKKTPLPPTPKVKVKTRRAVGKQFEESSQGNNKKLNTLSPTSAQPRVLVAENILTGNPYKIFCKFFDGCTMGDSNIKISLEKASTLMSALSPNKSKKVLQPGRGSHKKATIDLNSTDEMNPLNHLNNQVIILANHTYLLPYQIKQIREKFLAMGLYPREYKEMLLEKQLL